MENTSNNYSAFPVIAPDHGPIMTGLSKREYFAAMAMNACIGQEQSAQTAETIAKWSVKMADELLNQLDKTS